MHILGSVLVFLNPDLVFVTEGGVCDLMFLLDYGG